jgi:hypothetical protein
MPPVEGCRDCAQVTGRCATHSGFHVRYVGMTDGNPWPYPQPSPIYYSTFTPCDHCFCEDAIYPADHWKCCMCRTVRHRMFLPPRQSVPESGASPSAGEGTAEPHA